MAMDGYGITPKGQQDRRWLRAKPDDKPKPAEVLAGPYAHLRVVSK
jgi:hypothetical protein